jgi:hypothetical protein
MTICPPPRISASLTLGYGDISPARPLAEILVVLEAVTGMFYLAVIVASLIGAMRGRK